MTPDIMALAKGLGGGFPVGACLATKSAAAGMTPGAHGSTFGGNPLAMAVANAVLDVILEDGFMERVTATGQALQSRLKQIAVRFPKVIAEVRGLGLMIGIECVVPNTDLQAKLREKGLLTAVAGGNVIRILPPLIIGEAEIREACAIIEGACAALAA